MEAADELDLAAWTSRPFHDKNVIFADCRIWLRVNRP
jgi:hypothetical protein